MADKFYTIGEFASINKVSARMLRHYDKIGLLKPSGIAENGYRMYSSTQISLAGLIKKYRDCAFSLNEIALLVSGHGDVAQLAQEKIKELKQQETLYKDALCKLCQLTGQNNIPGFDNPYEVSRTCKDSQLFLISRHSCSEEEIEEEFDRLYDGLRLKEGIPAGLSMLLSDISRESGFKVAVPVRERFDITDYDFIVSAAGQYISTLHYGDYYGIGCAYDQLFLHAAQNGFECRGLFIEQYFLDRIHTANPAEYITQISIKITP